jgi:hypothetical protein
MHVSSTLVKHVVLVLMVLMVLPNSWNQCCLWFLLEGRPSTGSRMLWSVLQVVWTWIPTLRKWFLACTIRGCGPGQFGSELRQRFQHAVITIIMMVMTWGWDPACSLHPRRENWTWRLEKIASLFQYHVGFCAWWITLQNLVCIL